MNSVTFEIPGEPVAKGRPRFARQGAFIRTFTPDKTVNYENLVKLEYASQCQCAYLEGAIEAEIIAFFSIPKSASKKKQKLMADGEVLHTKKCDADNLAKTILDALNGIAFHDDSQVSILKVVKRYAIVPRVQVILKSLEG